MKRYRLNDYYKSQEWKRKRKAVFIRDNFLCQDCKIWKAEEVHHLHYRNLFNESLDDLISLCAPCHGKRHGIIKPHLPQKYNSTWDGVPFSYEHMVEVEIVRLNEKDD
jgi:5-methylcytosine-specific restriction endonuclease McrA